ncbi:MoaD/ThiS family protein [Williamsia maris]|uniref:Molybdopterin synthase sulfur carrier subunit n=1 Tax=Williamsia maris TaxID=72806 RepID=A0ABT1HJF7_9NOCA|nr:MoaD/ThiS family protein [Williamsia maris]MCP2178062.1 molybdopterin synthase sulfur carrier subunit [Williamsia maris]
MAKVLMFASAREASGARAQEIPGDCVVAVIDAAEQMYGPRFGEVVAFSRIWLNGDPVTRDGRQPCTATDELAILPPVAGG